MPEPLAIGSNRPSGRNVSAKPLPAQDPDSGLPARDESILDFERQWWRHVGAKEEAIRSQFGLSSARYYQLLNAVIDTPAAVRHDPMLVRRLQRARDARTKARAQRTFRISDLHDEETTD